MDFNISFKLNANTIEISKIKKSIDKSNLNNTNVINLKELKFSTSYIEENKELGTIEIEKGMQDKATLIVKKSITELISKNDKPEEYSYNIKVNKVKAPINSGQTVGIVEILDNEGLVVREEELTIKENIQKATLWHIFKNNFKTILSGK